MTALSTLWARLGDVAVLRFTSQSRTGIGWQGKGCGIVTVTAPSPDVLLFEELGNWQQSGGKQMRFTNVYRWTRLEERLRLEHLRFGTEKPVLLFEMQRESDQLWRESSPHLCKLDCYAATLRLDDEEISLRWTVRGPTRDEVIAYVYL